LHLPEAARYFRVPAKESNEYTPEIKERAFQMSFAGSSLSEIADAMQIPYGTIATWSSTMKWRARKLAMKNAPTTTEEEAAALRAKWDRDEKELAELEAMSFTERQTYYKDKAALIACRAARAMSNLDDAALIKSAGDVVKLDTFARKGLDLEKATPNVVANVFYLSQPIQQPSLPAPAEAPLLEVEATVQALEN
jgi:transposase-like protein